MCSYISENPSQLRVLNCTLANLKWPSKIRSDVVSDLSEAFQVQRSRPQLSATESDKLLQIILCGGGLDRGERKAPLSLRAALGGRGGRSGDAHRTGDLKPLPGMGWIKNIDRTVSDRVETSLASLTSGTVLAFRCFDLREDDIGRIQSSYKTYKVLVESWSHEKASTSFHTLLPVRLADRPGDLEFSSTTDDLESEFGENSPWAAYVHLSLAVKTFNALIPGLPRSVELEGPSLSRAFEHVNNGILKLLTVTGGNDLNDRQKKLINYVSCQAVKVRDAVRGSRRSRIRNVLNSVQNRTSSLTCPYFPD